MSALTLHSLPRLSRLSWLMGLYGENYKQLSRLFDLPVLLPGRYLSSCSNGLDLVVDVLEVHPYTQELRLSYLIQDPVTGQPDPSAYVRVYRDARQAEVTHCYLGRRWQDVLGSYPSPKIVFGHRLRMNSFFNKWLDYLTSQGHGSQTLVRLPAEAADAKSAMCA